VSEKKILIIIAPENFRDEEFKYPKKIFEESGFKVTVAGVSLATSRGMFGFEVTPETTVDKVSIDEYDALVIPGGIGAPELKKYPEVIELVKKANAQKKLVCAICLAPEVLGEAGILKGRKATVFQSSATKIENYGATYVPENLVKDENIITASGPDVAENFGYEIVKSLS
jgi:protease I